MLKQNSQKKSNTNFNNSCSTEDASYILPSQYSESENEDDNSCDSPLPNQKGTNQQEFSYEISPLALITDDDSSECTELNSTSSKSLRHSPKTVRPQSNKMHTASSMNIFDSTEFKCIEREVSNPSISATSISSVLKKGVRDPVEDNGMRLSQEIRHSTRTAVAQLDTNFASLRTMPQFPLDPTVNSVGSTTSPGQAATEPQSTPLKQSASFAQAPSQTQTQRSRLNASVRQNTKSRPSASLRQTDKASALEPNSSVATPTKWFRPAAAPRSLTSKNLAKCSTHVNNAYERHLTCLNTNCASKPPAAGITAEVPQPELPEVQGTSSVEQLSNGQTVPPYRAGKPTTVVSNTWDKRDADIRAPCSRDSLSQDASFRPPFSQAFPSQQLTPTDVTSLTSAKKKRGRPRKISCENELDFLSNSEVRIVYH